MQPYFLMFEGKEDKRVVILVWGATVKETSVTAQESSEFLASLNKDARL